MNVSNLFYEVYESYVNMEERTEHSRICQYCKPNQENDGIHIASPLHKFNVLLWKWNKERKSLVKNRHGVEVTISANDHPLNHDINNGRHHFKITPSELLTQANVIDFKCTVTNRSNNNSIYLTYANVLLKHTWFSFHNLNNNPPGIIEVKPTKKYGMLVKFETNDSVPVGCFKIPVCFSFETSGKRKDTFHIVREINITIADELLEQLEDAKSPFTGNAWTYDQIFDPICKVIHSNNYQIPAQYKKCLFHGLEEFKHMGGNDFDTIRELRNQLNPGNVTDYNYKNFWDIVLWLEETKQTLGLQQYNMESVKLTMLTSELLELEVPGLSEKRPSLVKGGMVDIRIHDDHTGYRGKISKVNNTTIQIEGFDPGFFEIIEDCPSVLEDMDIKFVLGRLPLERQHGGVERVVANQLLPYLFPPEKIGFRERPISRTVRDTEFFNATIATNQEQKNAVLNILNYTSTPYPYIIFGPPGTGKTVTLVEAILQLKKKTNRHILVCAPSNAACDLITEQLLRHCTDEELLRIMSENVDISNVHNIILPYTNYEGKNCEGNDSFRQIPAEYLKSYRIVVTTLTLAGKYTGKYTPDILCIDEAAQACEPEACCALGLMEKGKQIILAGDPKQLGPSLSSEVAKKYGLGISLLERLMECDAYTKHDSNFKTMLIQNFRNHSKILDIPNKLFYDKRLQPMSAKSENDPISKIFVYAEIQEQYKNRKHKRKIRNGQPIEFCNVSFEESTQGKSPSYFNSLELQQIIKYIRALLSLDFENEENIVRPTDIGVVTPYVRQVHKLKGLLKQNGLEEVEVGTTETFQGREKRIIIISTVRAKQDLLLEDHQYKLGFVSDKKRFNVALTRAMSKLIVIGCAHVLATDDKWLEYIDSCERDNSFCGAPFTRRTNDAITDTTDRIKNIKKDTQYPV